MAKVVGFIIGILVVLAMLVISWAVTNGIVYAIMWCFGLEWSWMIGTGIWLCLIVAKWIFSGKEK